MVLRSLLPLIKAVLGIAPVSISATTQGAAIDTQDHDSIVMVAMCGVITGAFDMTFSLEESDSSGSGFTAVAAGDVLNGSTVVATFLTATIQRIGYRGTKRYVRGVLTKNSGTSAIVAVWAELGHTHIGPETV